MAEKLGAPRRWGVGAVIMLALAALAVTVVIGVIRGLGEPSEPLAPPVTVEQSSTSLYVHVSGAVLAPGLYVLEPWARVVDAVAAAGGFAEDADPAAVNLARPLTDGEQLLVPMRGAAGDAAGEPAADGRINLNTADEAALDTLPRIGPAIAARIIEWREAHGAFTSVEDLLAVPGIGTKMLESLRALVTV